MKFHLTSVTWTVVIFVGLAILWSLSAAWFHPGYKTDDHGVLLQDEDGNLMPRGTVLLPSPRAVIADVYDLFAHERFMVDVLQSTKRIVVGLLASAAPAFVLGIWFGVDARVRSVVTPVFAFIQYIPPVGFVPILILWLGIGLSQQVAVLFVGTFFYLTVMVAQTVANTPQAYRDAALTLGARPGQLVWNVIIPFGLPEFIQHLRVIVGIAWTYLTVVEMVQADDGIGRVIMNSSRYLQTGRTLAGLVTIGFLGMLSDFLLLQASRLLCKWKE